MSPQKWRRLQKLFDQAVELPPEQREPWICEVCGDDSELRDQLRQLVANDRPDSLLAPVTPAVNLKTMNFEGREIPTRLGPYELLEQIGRGGMGAVYKAERVDAEYRSTVAIKLVRPGMDSDFVLSRFRRERQTLAKLSHPNIARLLDGGTTEAGIPYIVMEYISGAGINEYCRARRLNVRERISLFLPICAAVEYAHRNFVIHRDIKPGNILVDQAGAPKLLDFGICKLFLADQIEPGATADLTLTQGFGLMTPDYASPEQTLGEAVSPVSDVYSLGLVLYELLTEQGAHHIEKYTPLGIQEAVCRKEILLPSRAAIPPEMSAALRGDLDNILMKALQKEPGRRYESAAALAADLERYLKDEPVLARPDTTLYRARKFVRRNRLMVGASVAVLLALGIGGGVAVRQSMLARQADRASRELAREGLFKVYDDIRELPGTTAARQRIIERISDYLKSMETNPDNDPDVLRELSDGYRRVAELQGSHLNGATLGDPKAALASYQKALGYIDKILSSSPGDLSAEISRLELFQAIGDIQDVVNGPAGAQQYYRTAIQDAQKLLARSADDGHLQSLLGSLYMRLGDSERDTGQLAESESDTTQALSIFEHLSTATPQDVELLSKLSAAEAGVGMIQGRLGNFDTALQHYRRSVERNRQILQLKPLNVNYQRELMISLSHVGDVLGYPLVTNMERPELSVEPYEEMLSIARSIHEADPADVRAESDQAVAEYRLSAVLPVVRASEKKALLESSRMFFRARWAKDPGNVGLANNLTNVDYLLGNLHRDTGDRVGAQRYYRSVIETADQLAAAGHKVVGNVPFISRLELVLLDSEAGHGVQALKSLDELSTLAQVESDRLDRDVRTKGFAISGRALTARTMMAYSVVHERMGDLPAARQWKEKALLEWKRLAGLVGFSPDMRREMQTLSAALNSGPK